MVARTSINEIKQLYQEYQLSTTNHNEIVTQVIDLIFDTITNRSPAQIVDMGCGTNWVKKLPCMQPHTVIGVDWPIGIAHDEPLINSKYDKQGKLEEGDDWCIRHQEKFDVAIALCSIHYCLMSELPSRIDLLMQLVKPGGVAYITVNVQRMIDKAIELESLYRHKQFIQNELGKCLIGVDDVMIVTTGVHKGGKLVCNNMAK